MNYLVDAFERWQARSPKYAVHGGIVTAADGDLHYITAQRVMRLYGVEQKDCVLRRDEMRGHRDLIHLGPRTDGDYALPR